MGAFLRLPPAVHVLCVGSFVVSAGMMVIPFLTLYLSVHLGLGPTFATLALGAHGVGQLLGAVLGGVIADRYGRRPAMIGGLLAAAVLVTVLSQLTSPVAILINVVCFSVGVACYRPAASAMMSDLVPPEDRPTGYSLMYAAGNLGFALASGVGGVLAQHNYGWLFIADAVASLSFVLIIAIFIKETRPAVVDRPGVVEAGGGWSHVLANRAFLRFAAATFLTGMVFHQALSTLPLQMNARGLGVEHYGRVMSLNGVMIVVLQLALTAGLGRFNRALTVSVGDVLVALGFGLTAWAVGVPGFAVSVAIWTLGEIIHAAFKFSMVSDFAPPELRARYFGSFQGVYATATAIAPPLGGLLLTQAGPEWLWAACAAAGLLAAGLNFSLRRRLGVEDPSSPRAPAVSASADGAAP
ncbi:MAG: MFS transporter [Deltaproteobacteria bacterium]|nr:MFS transporter [Deltaproteobacteria bacterium]